MSKADLCLAHRYLYHVLNTPIISDYEYDILDKEAVIEEKNNLNHPIHSIGSDNNLDYTQETRFKAYLLMKHRGM